jgi:hypothetical protein
MGWACRMHGELRNMYNLKGRDCLEDLGTDGRITLNYIFRK